MADLVSTGTIVLLDKFTGPLRTMSGSVANIASGLTSKLRSLSTTGSQMMSMLGVGLGAGMMNDVADLDKAFAHLFSISGMSADRFSQFKSQLYDVSNASGMASKSFLELGETWIGLQQHLDELTPKMEGKFADLSRIGGIDMGHAASFGVAAARLTGIDIHDEKKFNHLLDVITVASKMTKGGAAALEEAATSYLPLALKSGKTIEQAFSEIAVMITAGFQPGETGKGLKTLTARLEALVPNAKAALRAQGIDIGKLFSMDPTAMRNSDALVSRIKDSGIDPDGIAAGAAKGIINEWDGKNVNELQDKLKAGLQKALGMKHGDFGNKTLSEDVDAFLGDATTQINMDELSKLAHMKPGQAAKIAGKDRIALFMDLIAMAQKIQAVNTEITTLGNTDVLSQRTAKMEDMGFWFQWGRMVTSFDNLKSRALLAQGGDLVNFFKGIADAFARLQEMDPEKLSHLFSGIGAGLLAMALPMLGPVGEIAAAIMAVVAAFELLQMNDGFHRFSQQMADLLDNLSKTKQFQRLLGTMADSLTAFGDAASAVAEGISGLISKIEELVNYKPPANRTALFDLMVKGIDVADLAANHVNMALEGGAKIVKGDKEGAVRVFKKGFAHDIEDLKDFAGYAPGASPSDFRAPEAAGRPPGSALPAEKPSWLGELANSIGNSVASALKGSPLTVNVNGNQTMGSSARAPSPATTNAAERGGH